MDSGLNNSLGQVQSKSRYISEALVHEETNIIAQELLAGEIQISQQSQQFFSASGTKQRKQKLNDKLIRDAEKQKQVLEQKLEYLNKSILSIKQKRELHTAADQPEPVRQSRTVPLKGRQDQQQWKVQIQQRDREIKERQLKVQRKKVQQQQTYRQQLDKAEQERKAKKKQEIIQKMQAIEERMRKREDLIKQGNNKIRQLKNEQPLHQKLIRSYQQVELSILEEHKKKLLQIRSLKRPINEAQIRDHEARFFELKRQRQQIREQQRKMSQSTSRSQKPLYHSSFYRKIIEDELNQQDNPLRVNRNKVKQFADHVKLNFTPHVSQEKKNQLQKYLAEQKRKQQQRKQKQLRLLQQSKIKGLEYLSMVKTIPKKKKVQTKSSQASTERVKYQNYLTHHTENPEKKSQKWSKILKSSCEKEEKAFKIQIQAQRNQQYLKRKQQHIKILNKGDPGQLDDQYFDMIRAKLQLLQTQ